MQHTRADFDRNIGKIEISHSSRHRKVLLNLFTMPFIQCKRKKNKRQRIEPSSFTEHKSNQIPSGWEFQRSIKEQWQWYSSRSRVIKWLILQQRAYRARETYGSLGLSLSYDIIKHGGEIIKEMKRAKVKEQF